MPEPAEVVRRHGPACLSRFADRMPPGHRRAIQDVLECRSEAMGGMQASVPLRPLRPRRFFLPLPPQPSLSHMSRHRDKEVAREKAKRATGRPGAGASRLPLLPIRPASGSSTSLIRPSRRIMIPSRTAACRLYISKAYQLWAPRFSSTEPLRR